MSRDDAGLLLDWACLQNVCARAEGAEKIPSALHPEKPSIAVNGRGFDSRHLHHADGRVTLLHVPGTILGVTAASPGPSVRGERRARGDDIVWLVLGVVLVVVGIIGSLSLLVFIGAFLIVPALVMLFLLRRARRRADSSPPVTPRGAPTARPRRLRRRGTP